MTSLLRQLPSVNALLEIAPDWAASEGNARATRALRDALSAARDAIRAGGDPPSPDDLISAAQRALAAQRAAIGTVINATGVIIHTNLGRAPLSRSAQEAVLRVARDYSPLEFDLETGERGRRGGGVERALCELTGAESALVVNNCAAATNLMLAALARGQGVVIARGQLVEIGGGFRVPEILAHSGARLIEVGTTNRVRPADYVAAAADAGAFLRVHASNFKMIGFVEEVPINGLVEIALGAAGRAEPPLVLDDLGSGALVDTSRFGLSKEPMAQDSVAAGADVVCFSGDKLLGGPQAGIMVGRRAAIERCRTHPLARAFRADKLTLAALDATLLHYARGEAEHDVPVLRMLAATPAEIETRARRVLATLPDALHAEIVDAHSTVGGGSLPGEMLPTRTIALSDAQPNRLAARLRAAPTPVVARVSADRVLLDLRTVLDDDALIGALRAVFSR